MDKRNVHYYRSDFDSSMMVADILKKSDYIILLKLANYGRGNRKGIVGCSPKELSDACGVSYGTMRNSLSLFGKLNLVKKGGIFYYMNPTVHYSGDNIKYCASEWIDMFSTLKITKGENCE